MASALPLGEPAPLDGLLPRSAADGAHDRAFGVYVHVPFCRVRCGYCDFNTYTAGELRGARQVDYADHAIGEIRMSRRRARGIRTARPRRRRPSSSAAGRRRCCPPTTSCAMLGAVRDEFGPRARCRGHDGGQPRLGRSRRPATRSPTAGSRACSFGMQSAVPHVLAALDRTHDPERDPARRGLGARRRASTSASTSSTARRGSRSPTGGAASRRSSRSGPTT